MAPCPDETTEKVIRIPVHPHTWMENLSRLAGAMEATQISFVPLLTVILLAFLVPLLLSRIRRVQIPVVVGEILAGIVVGQSGVGLVEETAGLRLLSELGFAFLMFLSGLELDFSSVLRGGEARGGSAGRARRIIGNPFFVGSMLFALTLVGSGLAMVILSSQGLVEDVWILALILSTTSLGVVVPVLKERGLTGERFGQVLLVAALVADFASILLISIYVLLLSQGPTSEILLVLVLFAASVATYRLATLFREHLPAERIFEELSTATSQIKTRGALALALVFIALAEGLGIEIILGAFLAGVIVSLLSDSESTALREKLDALGYGFFVPIFFIMVGVRFDLLALLGSSSALLLVPLLIGIAFLVKLIPSLLLRLWFPWRETLAAGGLLSARLSLIIAASAIGLELGLISGAINSAVILVALITVTLSPLLFGWLMPRREPRDRVVVVGARKDAGMLARRLGDHNLDVVLICGDVGQEEEMKDLGIPVICSQPTLAAAFRQAEVDRARAIVAMEPSDEDNLRICRMAREIYGVDNVLAWVKDPAQNDKFRRLGARIVNPAYSTMLMMLSLVLNPGVYSITPDVDETQEVREVKLQNSDLIGQRLADLGLSGNTMVLMIERGGDVLTPDRETLLRANDTITVVGTGHEVDAIAHLFARNRS
jgi:Kef-type K+ transport system membrane component KefB/Trk K+ transport system NAD-binding subunit